MDNEQYVVYVHINKVNGKRYFGITKNIDRRWHSDGIEYQDKRHYAFGEAVKKYGWDGFEHHILHRGLTLDEANELEEFYIAKYKTNITRWGNEFGYNMTDGGDTPFCTAQRYGEDNAFYGRKHTDESKQKMSQALTGRRSGDQSPHYGASRSEDVKHQISQSLKDWYANHGVPSRKRVYCIDDNLWFDSVKEAAKAYGIASNLISACCLGKHKTCFGKHFTYNLDGSQPKFVGRGAKQNRKSERPIICVETDARYSNAADAAAAVGLSDYKWILHSCDNGVSASGGFHWRYA